MFFYQTEHLQINSSVLGISKVFGQANMLLWGIIYNHYLKFYVVIFSGFLEVLFFFKILPFSVLIAQICPQWCEGSIMTFLMSAIAFTFIVWGYFGVALASYRNRFLVVDRIVK
ncbi:unnamed protein product [Lupinus luteus]|uniref:Uncharacterized protein n=1 Tax=Lupinus luteus TaxID=3873 RepID=A0AAV1WA88_LUPLU